MLKLEYDKLTIYEVEELHKTILQVYEKSQELTLDLVDVQKIDMPAIQLLISAQDSFKNNNLKFSLKNLSQELLDTLKLSGCDGILEVAND